ncbi:outer membrane beta-barrel protein [Geomesophilobacter sediminis]|uniref:Porin family protein n=1 Tax=Geomesophilobacter sediminis TaxID=2798584 RepID=A0A8J7JLZ8_9BACT|nr:outer membrane beta-barrel protein [Geomesophilobacter sediminis]MBJ6725520.1 porin family protein [Geomesophilobacter sediminis]
MKLRILFFLAIFAASLAGTSAYADSISGRLGLTGRIGFLVPADNRAEGFHNNTDSGFVGGGGFIYGLDDHLAAEFEVTRTSFGSDTGDFGITDLALGGQYRFQPRARLVPYLGAGLDILINDYSPYGGALRDVDTTVGAHVSGGVDYFIQRQVALTAEAKVLLAPNASVSDRFGGHTGNFDPSSFAGTVGIRYFFK